MARFLLFVIILSAVVPAMAQVPAAARSVADQRKDLELWWEQARALDAALSALAAAGGQAPALIALSAQLAPGSAGTYGALAATPEGEAVRKEFLALKPGASPDEAKAVIGRALEKTRAAASAFVEQSDALPPDPSGQPTLGSRARSAQGAPPAQAQGGMAPPPPPGMIPPAWNPDADQMRGQPPGSGSLLGVAGDTAHGVKPVPPLMPVQLPAAAAALEALKRRINGVLANRPGSERATGTAFMPGGGALVWDANGLFAGGGWRVRWQSGLNNLVSELEGLSPPEVGDPKALAATLGQLKGCIESDLFAPSPDAEKAAYDKLGRVYAELWSALESRELNVRPR